MLKLSNRQSLWPIAVVTIIFFLWGFAYGLLDTLNAQFQKVVKLSTQQTLGLHAAYYGGYLIGPLTLGRFILKRYGFKATMMVGLSVYGCGTLVFWPSAVLGSYTAFIISNFIVASGLSCLEVAANPYIALCGPLEYAEVRLNLSQAFQAIGTICSPLLATKVLFKNVLKADAPSSFIDVQWTYLGIAMFVYLLAIVFYYIPLPEATDEQLEELADRRSSVNNAKLGPWKVIYVTLGLGVFSQWVYVGLQECVGNNLQDLIGELQPQSSLKPPDFQTVAHTVFAAGRFLTAFLNYFLKPRWILLVLYGGLITCLALTMHLSGVAGAAIAQLTFAFEAGIFSIIFAMSMRGLGAHTKTGSAMMTAAISGGAVFPPIQWGVSNHHNLKYSYCVPLAAAVFGMLFPIYLNIFPAAQLQVDPIHERRINRRARRTMRQESASSMQDGSATQFGLAGIIARRRKNKQHEQQHPQASVEHVERRSVATPTSMVVSTEILGEKGAVEEPKPVQMKQIKGHVGDLALWPEQQTSEASSNSSSSGSGGRRESTAKRQVAGNSEKDDLDMMITRHRPVWEQDNDEDDGFDDYHAIMKKI
jgi:fucose permease